MNLQLKLRNFRKSLKLNQVKFAETLGFSQGTIANMESGKREVSKPVLLKIKEIYNVDLMSFGEVKEKTIETSNVVAIPFYNIGAAAGSGTYLDNEPEKEQMYFDKRYLKQILKRNTFDNLHVIYAKGDSMDSGWNQPDDIKDGDLLMVDTSQKTGNNQIFVINQNNELRVKLLKTQGDDLLIISKNKKYNTEHYTFENLEYNKIDIVGRVVWNGSKENV
jgi:phage repressor protein C with HTH and peptisase S24 domain